MSAWPIATEYLEIIPKIRILLLGSFRDGCRDRLIEIRETLRDKGFSNTCLSLDFNYPEKTDFERPEVYNLRVSEYWLRGSDIQIFIFFCGTDNASIGIELATHLNNPKNSWSTIVGVYENTPSLVAGLALRFNPALTLFKHSTDDEIISQCEGLIVGRLSQYYATTWQRLVGPWEMHSIK